MLLSKGIQSGSGFTEFAFFAHNVDKVQFAVERFAHSDRVIQRVDGHGREVNGDEDAVL